jgi:membrane fusion protein (multidrug efflux system)
VNLAAALATDCRDRARHHRDGGLDALEVVAGLPPGACTGWGEPGEAPRLPEGTAVPMLLLSGGYDAFQPDTAAVARRIGPAARHLEIPFASHAVRGSGVCARQIVGAWVDAPTAAPATTCLARASAPPFLLAVDVIPAVPRLMGRAGGPPAAALLGLGGVTIASSAGLFWPAGAALVGRLRRRASPRIAGSGWAALAALGALVSVLGLIGAVALAFQEARAALAFGLPVGWGAIRWLLVPGVVCALGAVQAAFRGRSWRVGLAGGGALVAFCAQAVLGLAPLPLRCCRGCVRVYVPGDRGAFREATERVHWVPSFMKTPFPRTARWMQDDQTPLPRPVLALLLLLSVGWGAWFFLGSVKVYAVSQVARTEVDTMAHGVQTPVAGVVTENRLRLGQRVEEGQVLLVLDSTAERLQLVQEQARRMGLQRTAESMKRQLDAEKAAVLAQQREASAAAQAAFARGRAARTVSDQASEEDKLIRQLRENALATGMEAMKSASEARRQSTEAAASSLEASRIAAQGQVGVADRMIQVLRLEHQLTGLQNDLDLSDATMGRLQFEIERKTLRAVVSGSVADLSPVPVGSTLDQGQKVAVVVPEGSHRVVARFSPSEAVGRVKPGQQGIVRLDAFPWTEYGVLRIQVGQLAHEPQEGLVRAELLVHGKNDAIPLGHGLTGSVEIELEELPPARLLLRSAGQLMAPAATTPPSPPQTSPPSARLP